jgi:hypothetical protein
VAEDLERTAGNTKLCSKHRTNGDPCGGSAMIGTDFCWHHGGAGLSQQGGATQRRVVHSAKQRVINYGAPVDIDPISALLIEVARTNGHILWLREKLTEQDPARFAESLWRHTGTRHEPHRAPNAQEKEEFLPQAFGAVWLELYHRERSHLVKVCTAAVGADAASRFARLMDAQGELIGVTIRAILNDLMLTPAQESLAARVVPQRLRALTTGENT